MNPLTRQAAVRVASEPRAWEYESMPRCGGCPDGLAVVAVVL